MKKFLIFTLLCLFVLPFASACGAGADTAKDGKLTVVTTVFPPYDFLRHVAGEEVNVTMLIRPGQDSHSYEATAADARLLAGCDLFVMVGGVSDYPFKKLIEASGKEIPTLRLMDSVEPHFDHADHADEHDHSEDVRYHEADEHIWTSPKNAIRMVAAIEEALCDIAPDKADTFRANAETYRAKLAALDEAYTAYFSTPRTLIFGDRFPFLYLAHDYNITCEAAFDGCSEQTEPSAKAVAAITDRLLEGDVKQIYYIESSNHTVADALAKSTGVRTALLHSCHSLTEEELAAGLDYLSLMERNLETIKEGD